MKYEIEGFENKEIIRCFLKAKETILIIYLDNHFTQIPNTEENEQNLLNEMINQALTREKTEINKLPLKNKYNFLNLIANISISIYMAYNLNINQENYIYQSDIYKFIYSAILAVSSANILRYINDIIYNYRLNKDVLKYHEFFKMKDEIDKYGDLLISEDTSLKEVLNINTIDFYSTSRMKEIINFIKENDNKEKTLIKNN